jgi:3-oxoadipate CoA-transferase beta subunit
MMPLFARDGSAKLVDKCSYPLTGVACVSRVYTDHAVFLLAGGDVTVRETYGISLADLRERVGLPLGS